MRIGIVYIGENSKLEKYKNCFVEKLKEKEHNITEIDGLKDIPRLSGFQYLVFFIDPGKPFNKRFRTALSTFLKGCGTISTHYASLFISKRIFCDKVFLRYMSILEKYGLIIHDSNIIQNLNEAQEIAESLKPLKAGD